jgi:hypothetical protein
MHSLLLSHLYCIVSIPIVMGWTEVANDAYLLPVYGVPLDYQTYIFVLFFMANVNALPLM